MEDEACEDEQKEGGGKWTVIVLMGLYERAILEE